MYNLKGEQGVCELSIAGRLTGRALGRGCPVIRQLFLGPSLPADLAQKGNRGSIQLSCDTPTFNNNIYLGRRYVPRHFFLPKLAVDLCLNFRELLTSDRPEPHCSFLNLFFFSLD